MFYSIAPLRIFRIPVGYLRYDMRMRTIPYFPQENEHVCGPAAAQMALAAFGIKIDQVTLEQKLETPRDGDKGTETAMMVKILRQYGLAVDEKHPGTVASIQNALTNDAVVIVCYTEPD